MTAPTPCGQFVEGEACVSQPVDRPYAGEADYAQMRDLLTAIPPLSGPAVYCTVGDLDWWR